jgi:hypothetical protein
MQRQQANPRSRILAQIFCAIALCWQPVLPARAEKPRDVAPSAVELAVKSQAFARTDRPPGKDVLTAADEKFLDDLERRGIQFFLDGADERTGLMPDRSRADGSAAGEVASIASVGFGLTALCIGDQRGWVSHEQAYASSLKVLKFLRDEAPQEHGHFYHFLDMRTGKRVWDCEVSNIDTALLMAGALTVAQHFPGTEVADIANALYENVDWPWLIRSDDTLGMAWRPESGFLNASWGGFSECPLLYLLALGSQTHPLPAKSWRAWRREPVMTYAGLTFIQCPPLFTHQFPHCWFDLRGQRDDFADYFKNSQLATLAQRQWFVDELSKRFPSLGANVWGITASDSAHGYDSWGGPPELGVMDGTVVPAAPAGSLVFEPRLCVDALRTLQSKYGEKGYLKYGFVDALNPETGWYNADVIGIDVGPAVLMAENCRSGFVWKTFMSSPAAQRALKAAGFRPIGSESVAPTTAIPGDAVGAGSAGAPR